MQKLLLCECKSKFVNECILLLIEYNKMEEKSKEQLTLNVSDWKLKQEVLRNQRNYRQLENRLIILEMQRQGKIKSIERKLESHKKIMEIRMDRYKLRQQIQQHEQSVNQEAGSNSRVFKEIRQSRAANIRSKSSQLKDIKNQLFRETRRKRQEHQHMIRQQSQKELQIKTQKRNRVRLIEIECKQNVNKFWNGRLKELKQMREEEMNHKMQQEQKKMQWLMNLQKSEEDLLKEIKKAEEMQSQLVTMMAQEKSMVHTAINSKG